MLQIYLATILVFLTGEVLTQQCFSGSGCTGSAVVAPGPSASDCCVGTDDGQSYGSSGDCAVPQCIVHGFEEVSYTTRESDALQHINFRPNLKGTGQAVNIGIITGTIVLEEDTATLSDIAYFSPVTVSQETNEALNILVIPQSDTISLELDDRIILRFTPTNPALTPETYFDETGEFLRDATNLRILDDDSLVINFFSMDYNVGEGEQTITIEMTIREAQIPFTLTLTPTTVDDVLADIRLSATDYLGEIFTTLSETGKATPGLVDGDYDDMVFVKVIPPSATSRVLSQDIRIKDDDINEVEQRFALVAELEPEIPDDFACFRVTFGDAECRGRVGTTGIRIRDNDPMILGFGERRQTVSEADATSGQEFINRQIFITSVRTSEIAYPVGVRSVIRGQPLIEPVDDIQNPMYDGLFGSREQNTITNLVIIDILEVNTVVLSPLHVTIRDDFLPEDEECFELSIFRVEPFYTVNFMCNVAGDEFLCIHEICIEDNDEPFNVRVGFNQTMYTVMESTGSVEVCVNLTFIPHDILGGQVTVLVFHNDNSIYVPPNPTFATPDPPMGTSNSHNVIPRSDYEEETRFASTIGNTFITEGRRKICYNQVIYDDERLELVEAAGLGLALNARQTVIPVEARYGDSVFFIIDDDEAVVGLERTIFTVSEDVGVVELCARVFEPAIDCPIEFPFDIVLSTTDRTAVSSMDYIGLSVTLTFDTCETRHCVNVNIVNDLVDEPDEVFDYSLEPTASGLDPRITIRPDMGEVFITAPVPTLSFSSDRYVVLESEGTVELCLVLNVPLSIPALDVIVTTTTTATDTATADVDFMEDLSLVTLRAGTTESCIDIMIINDDIALEGNETFTSQLSLFFEVPVAITTAVITIIDDDMRCPNLTSSANGTVTVLGTSIGSTATYSCDPGFSLNGEAIVNCLENGVWDNLPPTCYSVTVSFLPLTYTVTEGEDTTAELVLIRSGNLSRPTAVEVTTASRSADVGDDFTSIRRTVIFTVGVVSTRVEVPILDDTAIENTETFTTSLTTTEGNVVIANSSATVSILDDDFDFLTHQCLSVSGCMGDIVAVPGPTASDCCVGTEEGQSYGSPKDCTIPQCIVHGFEQLSYTTPESEALQGINFHPNIKGTGQAVNIAIISGTINLEEDIAIMSDISSFTPVSVPQETNAALNIQVIPQYDTIALELDDRINLRFIPSNPAITPETYFAGTGEFLRDVTSVRILDNDNLTINFFTTDYNVGEAEGFVTIEMTIREAQIPFTLTLTPTTVDGALADTRFIATDYLGGYFSTLSEAGKATPGDYDDMIFVRTIPPSSTSRIVSQVIRITDDNINEIEQRFTLVVELRSEIPDEFSCFRVTFGEAECRGRVGATGIRIRDNDPMILGFGERRQTVSEADAPPGHEFFDLVLFITSLRTSELNYPVGVRSVIRGQPIIEPSGSIVNPRFDGVFGIREANTITNLVVIENLRFNTSVLPALRVTIRDDYFLEEEECFELSIFPVNTEEMTERFMCNTAGDSFLCQHVICITDEDEPFRVAFDQTMYTVVESAGSVEVCVNLTHPPDDIFDEQVTVLVFHNDSSIYVSPNPIFATPDPPMGIFNRHNMIPGSDYEEETRFSSTIRSTFIEHERRQICYNQVIYDDDCVELTETVGLTLVPDDFNTQVEVEPHYGDSVFFIIDDDEAVVGLESFTVSEDVGVVELCAHVFEPDIDCPVEFPFTVVLSSTDRTAVSPMDYGGFSVTLTFDACTIRRCVNVNIVNDVVHEPDEVFDYNLGPPPASLDPRITFRPEMGEVLIADDDALLELINESPRVIGNSVEAEFKVNGPVTGIRCVLRSQVDRLWKDCSPAIGSMSAAVSFTDLKPGLYALKVQAYSRNDVVPTVKRGFVITSDPNYCSLVLVNRGVTVTGNSALITTQLYGPATQLSCTLDGGDPFICRNPVFLSGLESGRHVVEISPLGCSGGSKTLSVKFSV